MISCAACSVTILLMLCNATLHDRAVFAMWSWKVSWSSKISQSIINFAAMSNYAPLPSTTDTGQKFPAWDATKIHQLLILLTVKHT